MNESQPKYTELYVIQGLENGILGGPFQKEIQLTQDIVASVSQSVKREIKLKSEFPMTSEELIYIFQDLEKLLMLFDGRFYAIERATVSKENSEPVDILDEYEKIRLNYFNSNESRDSFRKIGLTFEEKAFYDILVSLRDRYNFEYGTDKEVDGVIINGKCKYLAKKVKEIIDTKSSYADWLNNQNVRNQLSLEIKICLVKNGYPPQYSPEVFTKVMEQVENFEENY